jgi:hypothetical protein
MTIIVDMLQTVNLQTISKYDRKRGNETTTEEINITKKIEETENINS